MENHCVNLLSEHFKQIFNEPNNKEVLKYLISTFLNVPEEEMKERFKVYYDTLLNTVEWTNQGINSNLIVMYDEIAIKIVTYHTEKSEFIIHMFLGSLDNNYGKLIELRFSSTEKQTDEIVESYSLRCTNNPKLDIVSGLLQVKLIDTSRLPELDTTTSMNRWIKFIGATTKEERLAATANDEKLLNLYNWLEN